MITDADQAVPVQGICQRCGREFFTLPKDGKDRYAFLGEECGGEVKPVNDQ